MMRITVWLAVVAMALLAACTSEPEIRVRGERFNDEQLALGEQLYIQNCASCHGVNGEGQFPNAPLQPDAPYIKTMWTDEQRTRQQQVTEAEVSE